jgi:hypothetical protein
LFDMPAKESDSRLPRQHFSPETAQSSQYTAPPRIRDCERFRWQHYGSIKAALEQFGTYDFQRDKATNTHFSAYVDAANYAVGVYMAGAGYGPWETLIAAQTYALGHSSNRFDYEGKAWTLIGWEAAHHGAWRSK